VSTYLWYIKWVLDNGIPLLLQIFFIFLALPQLGIYLPGFWAGVLALAINYGARMSGNFYDRFANTEKNQDETQLSLIPVFANEFIGMIKDSTLISMTGFIHEAMWRATRVGRVEFKNLEAFIIAAIIYLILISIISYSVKLSKAIMPTAK
jgi:polar amino acid transport system permease protein